MSPGVDGWFLVGRRGVAPDDRGDIADLVSPPSSMGTLCVDNRSAAAHRRRYVSRSTNENRVFPVIRGGQACGPGEAGAACRAGRVRRVMDFGPLPPVEQSAGAESVRL